MISEKTSEAPPDETKYHAETSALNTQQFGVWQVLTLKYSPLHIPDIHLGCFIPDLSPAYRIFKDVFKLGPSLFIFYVTAQILFSVETSVSIYLSNRLLN